MDSADNNNSINSMAIIDEIEDDRSDIDSVNNDNSESAVDSDQEHVEEDEEESNSGKFTEKPFVYNNLEVNIICFSLLLLLHVSHIVSWLKYPVMT